MLRAVEVYCNQLSPRLASLFGLSGVPFGAVNLTYLVWAMEVLTWYLQGTLRPPVEELRMFPQPDYKLSGRHITPSQKCLWFIGMLERPMIAKRNLNILVILCQEYMSGFIPHSSVSYTYRCVPWRWVCVRAEIEVPGNTWCWSIIATPSECTTFRPPGMHVQRTHGKWVWRCERIKGYDYSML